jgi:hypothetical protein
LVGVGRHLAGPALQALPRGPDEPIRVAGGITRAYALTGCKLLVEGVELVDGLHRWVVAAYLGIGLVSVEMSTEEAESPFAW